MYVLYSGLHLICHQDVSTTCAMSFGGAGLETYKINNTELHSNTNPPSIGLNSRVYMYVLQLHECNPL